MFSGSIVALVTPFRKGTVDFKKLAELVEFHISKGTNGIVITGTTGEAPTLTLEEKHKITKTAIKVSKGKIPIIAGTGTNCTRRSIEEIQIAKEAGVDGVLVVTPYYNRPSQEGLYEHFKAIACSIDIPIILYNVPSRTGINLEPQTIARLAKLKNIVAIKEASGNLDQVTQIRLLSKINILSGDDSLTFPIMCIGGKGVISVAGNIIPNEMTLLCKSALEGDFTKAQDLHLKFYNLFKAMFIEANPVPVKTAMKLIGMLNGEVRAPLVAMEKNNQGKLKAILENYNLLP